MKLRPPCRARAFAIASPLTDCMIALTKGMFSVSGDEFPLENFTKGVFKETLEGMQVVSE
ncbi:hypothetical protein SDC9_99270 [bioreactor metagenome]|uniref:Uncharacterized protein n=1 Tax=bioreactor metagenome TaxID=1076179 RepID=A0A645AH32_9ZZZZ